MATINHKMIQLARESRGMLQVELAKELGIQPSKLSRIERGTVAEISDSLIESLATVLNYPRNFFEQDYQIYPPNIHYRKRGVVNQKALLRADALMNIYRFNIQDLLQSVALDSNVPKLTDAYDSPERVAQYLRRYWNVPSGPIENLTSLLEKNGIIVVQMDFGTDDIDGRSVIADGGQPIIFVNKNKSGDRQRLTIAHELGHIIMHLYTIPTFGRDEEAEAFRFASEFLMPLHEVKHRFNGRVKLETLAELKAIWKISMQAILKRLQTVGIVAYNQARYLWSQFNTYGIRRQEPVPIPQETPALINEMIDLYLKENEYTKNDLVEVFRIKMEEVEERYFNKGSSSPFLRVA